MTGTLVVNAEGEVFELADLAAMWADLAGERARLLAQRAELAERERATAGALAEVGEALLGAMSPGDALRLPDGRAVVCEHGRRRNSTVDRAACEEHLEVLEAHGLVERVEQPPPPPVVRYPTVSALRAAERELALAGVRVAALVAEGGPGAPALAVVEAPR